MMKPDKAFILAAGFGTRLRPYTDHCPKPMVEVGGQSLITRSIDRLAEVGVRDVVVNLHYMGDVLRAHLEDYMRGREDVRVHFSPEDPILDTGGGVKAALPMLGDAPFYVIAGDSLWEDGAQNALLRLAAGWDDAKMDILTLMQPLSRMVLTKGAGDFDMLDGGRVRRSLDKTGTHMWTNIRLNHPRIFEGSSQGAFSFLPLMDACEAAGRFYALEHDGDWHHISTAQDLEAVREVFGAKMEKDERNSGAA